jgi:hypothetical protein
MKLHIFYIYKKRKNSIFRKEISKAVHQLDNRYVPDKKRN